MKGYVNKLISVNKKKIRRHKVKREKQGGFWSQTCRRFKTQRKENTEKHNMPVVVKRSKNISKVLAREDKSN